MPCHVMPWNGFRQSMLFYLALISYLFHYAHIVQIDYLLIFPPTVTFVGPARQPTLNEAVFHDVIFISTNDSNSFQLLIMRDVER